MRISNKSCHLGKFVDNPALLAVHAVTNIKLFACMPLKKTIVLQNSSPVLDFLFPAIQHQSCSETLQCQKECEDFLPHYCLSKATTTTKNRPQGRGRKFLHAQTEAHLPVIPSPLCFEEVSHLLQGKQVCHGGRCS